MEPKDIAIEGARAGRCAIVGRPNVGKSTLLNALLGQKLAIVTDTPGTTRTCLLGVYASVDPPTQIAFVDTPGITRPKSVLGKALIDQTQSGMLELDVLVFVVEPPGKKFDRVRDDDQALIDRVAPEGVPIILAINKVDLAKPKQKLLPYMEAWAKVRDFATMVPLSALKSENLAPLVSEIRELLPEGLQYEDELLTDRPLRYFVAELVREAAIDQTRREVPQGVAVLIDDYEDLPGLAKIKATLVVEKKSHKGIVIGAGGQRLKEIGTNARLGIEALIEKKVYLELFVKVVEGWTANPVRVRQMLVGES